MGENHRKKFLLFGEFYLFWPLSQRQQAASGLSLRNRDRMPKLFSVSLFEQFFDHEAAVCQRIDTGANMRLDTSGMPLPYSHLLTVLPLTPGASANLRWFIFYFSLISAGNLPVSS